MSDEQPAVIVKNVSKTFQLPHEKNSGIKQATVNLFNRNRGFEKQKVLNDISFEIKKGEFFGIVGRNGSGKSTLLKLLAGIYVPDEGLISINGSLTPFIELGVGFNHELTGRENVYMNGALLGMSRDEVEKIYEDIVAFAELEKFMDQKLKNYSSGMQVRLAFSIAVRAESSILLFDEVLAVGDAAFQQKCYEKFAAMKDEGRTIILVTHDMSAVQRFCTRAILIDKGKIKMEGDPFDIADLYTESNIQEKPRESNDDAVEKQHKLAATITHQDDSKAIIEFDYLSKEKDEMYIGISVLKNGISIAEITTPLEKPLFGKGHVTYELSKHFFNEGVYNIAAALFKKEDRQLIAVSHKRNILRVKGFDITKGGALKLENTWEYK